MLGEVIVDMDPEADALARGARNLLEGCAQATAGQSLLIVHEDTRLGYYGTGLVEAVTRVAEGICLDVRQMEVPFVANVDNVPSGLAAAIADCDHALFLARLGDQLRFRDLPQAGKCIVSYALDRDALASPFGTAPHSAFAELKRVFDAMFASARGIRVTCPLGTDISGSLKASDSKTSSDASIKRFPVSVFSPLDAGGFTGRVAVAHMLVGTGSRYYDPYGLALGSTLLADISDSRIAAWDGDAADVARAKAHYRHVGDLFGIDRDCVHSWHAGIHPGCAYPRRADQNYERWSGSAFGNPRLLHFHTCGAYAPGEICLNVVDPTIAVDGVDVWKGGRLDIDKVPGASSILARHPGVRSLFDNPSSFIGLGGNP